MVEIIIICSTVLVSLIILAVAAYCIALNLFRLSYSYKEASIVKRETHELELKKLEIEKIKEYTKAVKPKQASDTETATFQSILSKAMDYDPGEGGKN